MRDASVAKVPLPRLLTTADCAKVLGVSRNGVRYLVRQGDLAVEPTRSGQLIFHAADVQRCLVQRADARSRSRPAILAAVHLHMVKAGIEPRQLSLDSLFRRALRLVASTESESALCDRPVKASRSGAASIGSESVDYVNRKVAIR